MIPYQIIDIYKQIIAIYAYLYLLYLSNLYILTTSQTMLNNGTNITASTLSKLILFAYL